MRHFFTQSNYLENADTNSYQIIDLAVINVQNEGFRESQEQEEEEDHLIDGKNEEVIFVDCSLFFNLFFMRDRF